MKRYILTLILSLVTLCSYGQSGRLIYGCVYGERKMPLQGAKITTPHGELICTTDQNGQFNAQSSTYIKEIVVLHDDYQTKYVKVDGSYLIIKMRAATQTHTETTDNVVDAEEEVQTTNLIAEHEARIANERRAAAEEEAAKIRAEKIAKLEAERAAAKEEAQKIKEERKAEMAAINKEISGWQNMIAVSIYGLRSHSTSVSIGYIGGKRFSNALFLGFGIGATFNNYFAPDSGVGYENFATNLTLPLNKLSIPVYINLKLYLSRTKCQPYLSLSTGLNMSRKRTITATESNNLYNSIQTNDISYGTMQYFITPSFGIDFRLRSKSVLSVMAGLQMITAPYMDEYEDTKHYYYTIKHKLKYGYFIQIGYKF